MSALLVNGTPANTTTTAAEAQCKARCDGYASPACGLRGKWRARVAGVRHPQWLHEPGAATDADWLRDCVGQENSLVAVGQGP